MCSYSEGDIKAVAVSHWLEGVICDGDRFIEYPSSVPLDPMSIKTIEQLQALYPDALDSAVLVKRDYADVKEWCLAFEITSDLRTEFSVGLVTDPLDQGYIFLAVKCCKSYTCQDRSAEDVHFTPIRSPKAAIQTLIEILNEETVVVIEFEGDSWISSWLAYTSRIPLVRREFRRKRFFAKLKFWGRKPNMKLRIWSFNGTYEEEIM